MSTLFIIGMPIGNPQDITLRALNKIQELKTLFCEDTRVTFRLLKQWEILPKKLVSCRSHNEEHCVSKAIALLKEGQDVGFVSDAGSPGISDPGAKLVRGVRKAGYSIIPLPGVSALTTLISVSGYADSILTFEGFLPQKGEKRIKRLQQLYQRDEAFLLFESPFRLLKLLSELITIDSQMRLLIGREMTKNFEEYQEGTAESLYNYFLSKESLLGEFCLVVSRKSVKKLYENQ